MTPPSPSPQTWKTDTPTRERGQGGCCSVGVQISTEGAGYPNFSPHHLEVQGAGPLTSSGRPSRQQELYQSTGLLGGKYDLAILNLVK